MIVWTGIEWGQCRRPRMTGAAVEDDEFDDARLKESAALAEAHAEMLVRRMVQQTSHGN